MNEFDFQTYKGAAVVGAFTFSSLLQFLVPYQGNNRDILKNWKINLPLATLNVVLMGLVCAGCVCTLANAAENNHFGLTNMLGWPLLPRLGLTIVGLDLVGYSWHRINHRLPVLWRFHAVHHSDQVFDTSTAVRFHPGELLISLGIRLAVVAALGLPVAGILAFEMIYGLFNLVEHGNIRLPSAIESLLALGFITPALHRKHHSQNVEELNRNFGTIFSIWDRLFGSFASSHSTEIIAVGLPGSNIDPFRIMPLLRMPFELDGPEGAKINSQP